MVLVVFWLTVIVYAAKASAVPAKVVLEAVRRRNNNPSQPERNE